MSIKKLKNETELLREAIRVGTRYFEGRGAGSFEATDHIDLKVRAIYPVSYTHLTLPTKRIV